MLYKKLVVSFLLIVLSYSWCLAESKILPKDGSASLGDSENIQKKVAANEQDFEHSWQSQSDLLIYKLPQSGRLVVASNQYLSNEIPSLLEEIKNLYKTSSYYSETSNLSTLLKLTTPTKFHNDTGMPEWTNALFYKGTILLPIDKSSPKIFRLRTVRHEFTHSVVHNLSGGACPAWLDEGLAQMAEGVVRPKLRDLLSKWLKNNDLIPLSSLTAGFTKMDPSIVAVAYAESLFATKFLEERYGQEKILTFLKSLKKEDSQNTSVSRSIHGLEYVLKFREIFGVSLRQFENELREHLNVSR